MADVNDWDVGHGWHAAVNPAQRAACAGGGGRLAVTLGRGVGSDDFEAHGWPWLVQSWSKLVCCCTVVAAPGHRSIVGRQRMRDRAHCSVVGLAGAAADNEPFEPAASSGVHYNC